MIDADTLTRSAASAAEDTLNRIVARYPGALPVLQGFGLDTCCGGALPLQAAAQHHGLDLAELMSALRAELEGNTQ